jgi:hypothetical protein
LSEIVSSLDKVNTQGRDVIWSTVISEYHGGDLAIGGAGIEHASVP